MSRLLFELGVEEMPSRFMKSTINQIENATKKLFLENRISFEEIKINATPRRFILLVEGLSDRQEDLEEEVKGPSKKISFDEDNNPKKPLEGFLRSKNLSVDDIYFKTIGKDEYVHAKIKEEGKETKEILKTIIPNIILSINHPKSMKWGGKNLKFARPIRWLLTLFNNEALEFDLEGIKSSNITRGHRFLGESKIEINTIEEYFEKLEKNFVIVDQDKRKAIIKEQCRNVAKDLNGTLLEDEDLFDEVSYILEYPTAFYGDFDKEYLKLPKEAIITPMKEHQRYFPVVDSNGNLLPNFITVRNGDSYKIENVKKGNEKVLEARLSDALFFFKEDTKKDLESYFEKLDQIVFQEKLGTIKDKTLRIRAISAKLNKLINLNLDDEKINRVSKLFKSDLVTNMVFEFTELQGVMGREYAKLNNEDSEVCEAIYEHYLPRFAGDELPKTKLGVALSIADKIDSICGFFSLNIKPTGSQDPYALRRQALGILNIIIDNEIDIDLKEIISISLEELKHDFDKEKVLDEILDFFRLRFKNILEDLNIRYDVIDSIIDLDANFFNLRLRALKLVNVIDNNDTQEALVAFNRVNNLASKLESKKDIDESLLKEDEEKKLFDDYKLINNNVINLLENSDYDKALVEFIKIKTPVDNMLDNVMIMDKDEAIKTNRLNLLRTISDLMLQICDLSKIVYKNN